jgi:hypothetical protein
VDNVVRGGLEGMKGQKCGNCNFFSREKEQHRFGEIFKPIDSVGLCTFFKGKVFPAWSTDFRLVEEQHGTACYAWEIRKPETKQCCGTCNHWSERGIGSGGFGTGPCMAPVPIFINITGPKEMLGESGVGCETYVRREGE